MGKLEKGLRADIRRTKINKAIVGIIAVAGALAVGAIAPNVLETLGNSSYLKQRRYQIKSTLSRMIEKGYVRLEKKDGRSFVRLTQKGERFALSLKEGKYVPKKPKRWDGKWRMVIFDIPEYRRGTRTKVRAMFQNLDFKRLQDSVWVYPYDCEDLVILLKADFKIGKDLLYIIADKIEYDAPLRSHFNLR